MFPARNIPEDLPRPFFDRVTIKLPAGGVLEVHSQGAPEKLYVQSVGVGGQSLSEPVIKHERIAEGGQIVFEMAEEVSEWTNMTG